MICKQSENRVNKGEKHNKVSSSPPKRKEMMEISVSEQVLGPSKNIKRKKKPGKRATENRVG